MNERNVEEGLSHERAGPAEAVQAAAAGDFSETAAGRQQRGSMEQGFLLSFSQRTPDCAVRITQFLRVSH